MKKINILEKFIVLEGLDGSGTTTQMEMLESYFKRKGIKCFTTMEPTGSVIGKLIRQVLKKDLKVTPETLALLFSADRNEHIYGPGGIIEYQKKGYWIICDRYLFSSIAYQSLLCRPEWVLSINDYPFPEYLFFLDVPEEVCRKRLNLRNSDELFDDFDIQKQILDNYNSGFSIAAEKGVKFIGIDGTEKPGIISEKIRNNLSLPADN